MLMLMITCGFEQSCSLWNSTRQVREQSFSFVSTNWETWSLGFVMMVKMMVKMMVMMMMTMMMSTNWDTWSLGFRMMMVKMMVIKS